MSKFKCSTSSMGKQPRNARQPGSQPSARSALTKIFKLQQTIEVAVPHCTYRCYGARWLQSLGLSQFTFTFKVLEPVYFYF